MQLHAEHPIVPATMMIHKPAEGAKLFFHHDILHHQWAQLSHEESQSTQTLVISKKRDRYHHPLVFEHSRVKLDTVGYINANFLLDHEYIATQAPFPSTIPHFWSMIWQESISLIIMLTPINEDGQEKAHRYWPTSNFPTKRYQDPSYPGRCDFVVKLLEKSVIGENLIMRRFQLCYQNEFRQVIQFQHIEWPDHGCPDDNDDIVSLLSTLQEWKSAVSKPILVHCSAGIGRTGTFITIRYELMKAVEQFHARSSQSPSLYLDCDRIKEVREFLRNHEFTVVDTVRKLRKDRKMMVHNQEQFAFCYRFFESLLEESEYSDYLLRSLLPIFYEHDS